MTMLLPQALEVCLTPKQAHQVRQLEFLGSVGQEEGPEREAVRRLPHVEIL